MAEICLAFTMLGITAYAVFGGADFGAGFWDLTAGTAEGGGRVRGMIQRSMAPVWEANHVWLIFVLVIVWTAFPVAFASIFSTLSIPLFLVAIGIIFRGAAFALRGQAGTIREAKVLGGLFALSSVLIPIFIGATAGGIASGRVEVGNAAGDPITSWVNPTSALIGVLAMVTGAHVAAVYLAGDSARADVPDMVRAFKRRALGSGVVAGLVAMGGILVVRSDAPDLFDGLLSGKGLAMVILSGVAGAATLALVLTERWSLARVSVGVAVGAICLGWVFAQDPYFLPGEMTLEEAAASEATLSALVVAVGVGMIILVPSLIYLYRLVLKGTLDQEFEPLDQRFRPQSAGGQPPPGAGQ